MAPTIVRPGRWFAAYGGVLLYPPVVYFLVYVPLIVPGLRAGASFGWGTKLAIVAPYFAIVLLSGYLAPNRMSIVAGGLVAAGFMLGWQSVAQMWRMPSLTHPDLFTPLIVFYQLLIQTIAYIFAMAIGRLLGCKTSKRCS